MVDMISHLSLFCRTLGFRSACIARFIVEKCFRDVFVAFLCILCWLLTHLVGTVSFISQHHSMSLSLQEFYDGFVESNILDDHKSFQLKW